MVIIAIMVTTMIMIIIIIIITHANLSRGGKAFIRVCVCLSVRATEPKRLKLQLPNFPQ